MTKLEERQLEITILYRIIIAQTQSLKDALAAAEKARQARNTTEDAVAQLREELATFEAQR